VQGNCAGLDEKRRRLEAEMRQAQKMEAVGRLGADRARLQQYIMIVRGYAEILLESASGGSTARVVQAAQTVRSGQSRGGADPAFAGIQRKQVFETQNIEPSMT